MCCSGKFGCVKCCTILITLLYAFLFIINLILLIYDESIPLLTDDADDSENSEEHSSRLLYFYLPVTCCFFLMIIVSILVCVGLWKESVVLLKWPGRFLVVLIAVMMGVFLADYWLDIESPSETSFVFLLIIGVPCVYFIMIHRTVKELEGERNIHVDTEPIQLTDIYYDSNSSPYKRTNDELSNV